MIEAWRSIAESLVQHNASPLVDSGIVWIISVALPFFFIFFSIHETAFLLVDQLPFQLPCRNHSTTFFFIPVIYVLELSPRHSTRDTVVPTEIVIIWDTYLADGATTMKRSVRFIYPGIVFGIQVTYFATSSFRQDRNWYRRLISFPG